VAASMTICFNAYEINSQHLQDSESDLRHAFGVVHYDLVVDETHYRDLKATVRQAYQMGHLEPIELMNPELGDYKGSVDIHKFTEATEDYLRPMFGAGGNVIDLNGGAVKIINSLVVTEPFRVTIEIPYQRETSGGWELDGNSKKRPRRVMEPKGGVAEMPDGSTKDSTQRLDCDDQPDFAKDH